MIKLNQTGLKTKSLDGCYGEVALWNYIKRVSFFQAAGRDPCGVMRMMPKGYIAYPELFACMISELLEQKSW